MFEIPGSDIVHVHVIEDAVNGKTNLHYTRSEPIKEEIETDKSSNTD